MKHSKYPRTESTTLFGAKFSALSANIKYEDRKDLMLIYLDSGSKLTGVFTKSLTRSASVIWSEKIINNVDKNLDEPFAILVNSGNANAFTGRNGHSSVKHVMKALSDKIGISINNVLMASTGVIGEDLPYQKIINAIPRLVDSLSTSEIESCARAIMTTDTYPKVCKKKVKLGNELVSFVGIAKGSGMIAPNMGTMLSFIITDAKISLEILHKLTKNSCEKTFNSITVDSDTSTSDMVLVAATAKVAMDSIEKYDDPRVESFNNVLEEVMKDLALEIVRDGEGASKLVEYQVVGAVNDHSAKIIALSIANSPLVKTALAGEDPNWGRIVMAIGKSSERIDQEKIVIHIGENIVAQFGKVAENYNEKKTQEYMRNDELYIKVDLGLGDGKSTIWGCDFTKEYVEINADYRS